MALLGELDEVQGKVLVRQARRQRRAREPGLRVQVAVGVDVDDPRLAARVDPQVDPAIVPALERLEGRERDVDAARAERLGQVGQARGAVEALW